MRPLSIIFLVIIFVACSGPVPRGILPPEKMQQVVYDLIRIDEFVNNFVSKDSTVDLKKKRSVLYEQIFKIYDTNRKQFFSSYRYYQQHPDIQKALYDSLLENLNRTQIEMDSAKQNIKVRQKKDTAKKID